MISFICFVSAWGLGFKLCMNALDQNVTREEVSSVKPTRCVRTARQPDDVESIRRVLSGTFSFEMAIKAPKGAVLESSLNEFDDHRQP